MTDKLKHMLKRVLCGIAIGIGFVLPGVSGGVLAVSMGLYESMIDAIKNILRRFRESFLYLLPIAIGGAVGVMLTAIALKAVIAKYETETLCLFCGFMSGSLPVLWHESLTEKHKGFRGRDVLYFLGGLGFMLLLLLLDTSQMAEAADNETHSLPPALAMAAGGIMAVGIIVPGLSCSFLLEYFGLYRSVVNAIADVYIPTLFFCGVGFILPAIGMILLISYLFKRHRASGYLTVMGISVGSMLLIVPTVVRDFSWICVPLFAVGLAIGLWQGRLQIKKKTRETA